MLQSTASSAPSRTSHGTGNIVPRTLPNWQPRASSKCPASRTVRDLRRRLTTLTTIRKFKFLLLGGRPMVGLQTLDLAIGVRVPASQPIRILIDAVLLQRSQVIRNVDLFLTRM